MHKGLFTILFLSILCTLALVLSPNTFAERAETTRNYEYSPENDEVDAVVYPNPAEENIFVRLDLINPSLTNSTDIDLEIRNILGNPMPIESERIDPSRFRIITADYPSGYYLLIVRCQECEGGNRPLKNVFKFLKK